MRKSVERSGSGSGPRPRRIPNRCRRQDVAELVGLECQVVAHPRVVGLALVVVDERLPRMRQKDGVLVRSPGLEPADGKVLFGDRLGIPGPRRAVVRLQFRPRQSSACR